MALSAAFEECCVSELEGRAEFFGGGFNGLVLRPGGGFVPDQAVLEEFEPDGSAFDAGALREVAPVVVGLGVEVEFS